MGDTQPIVSPAQQITRLEYVIRSQMAEIDRLRAEIDRRDGRLNALTTAFSERGTLGILQMLAHDSTLDPALRIRAASAAVPYETPKLSMAVTAQVPLFDLLEERRRRAKTVEHGPPRDDPGPSAA